MGCINSSTQPEARLRKARKSERRKRREHNAKHFLEELVTLHTALVLPDGSKIEPEDMKSYISGRRKNSEKHRCLDDALQDILGLSMGAVSVSKYPNLPPPLSVGAVGRSLMTPIPEEHPSRCVSRENSIRSALRKVSAISAISAVSARSGLSIRSSMSLRSRSISVVSLGRDNNTCISIESISEHDSISLSRLSHDSISLSKFSDTGAVDKLEVPGEFPGSKMKVDPKEKKSNQGAPVFGLTVQCGNEKGRNTTIYIN